MDKNLTCTAFVPKNIYIYIYFKLRLSLLSVFVNFGSKFCMSIVEVLTSFQIFSLVNNHMYISRLVLDAHNLQRMPHSSQKDLFWASNPKSSTTTKNLKIFTKSLDKKIQNLSTLFSFKIIISFGWYSICILIYYECLLI